MNNETFDASQAANGTAANIDSQARLAQLNQLYFNSYSNLVSTCYETHPTLLVFDAERIMELLSESLRRYKGPSTDEAFAKWATRIVTKEAQRYAITARLLTDYDRVIRAAIHTNMWTSAQERSIEPADLYSEISYLIFKKAHGLNRKGSAKLSTRLTALVKKHCWLYYNSPNRRHLALVRERLENDLPIHVPELAKPESAGVYDPGYSEAGLALE